MAGRRSRFGGLIATGLQPAIKVGALSICNWELARRRLVITECLVDGWVALLATVGFILLRKRDSIFAACL
jgi:hypothetical protein